jgi:hypothetical protein
MSMTRPSAPDGPAAAVLAAGHAARELAQLTCAPGTAGVSIMST